MHQLMCLQEEFFHSENETWRYLEKQLDKGITSVTVSCGEQVDDS